MRLNGPVSTSTKFQMHLDANGLNYHQLQNDRHMFRHMDKKNTFSRFDQPGAFFWKPIFYFAQGGDEYDNAGLLYPGWIEDNVTREVDKTTCAYNYLMRNAEERRAILLRRFIELLSDISSKSPWYFKELSGIDSAMGRAEFFDEPKVEEKRKQIVIKCLPDSVDTRIGELLDIYRAVSFSWSNKREILPANLRKFNLGIYVFSQPYQSDKKQDIRTASHMYFEFINCEIDIDSCKIGDSFNNEEAQSIEYSIAINYDDVFTDRYSNNIVGSIGDSIITDILKEDYLYLDTDEGLILGHQYGDRVVPNLGYGVNQPITDAIVSTVSQLEDAATAPLRTMLLGNLYYASVADVVEAARSGRLNAITGALSDATHKVVASVADTISKPARVVAGLYNTAVDRAMGVYNAAADRATNSAVGAIEKAANYISNPFNRLSNLYDTAADKAVGAMDKAANSAIDAINRGFDKVDSLYADRPQRSSEDQHTKDLGKLNTARNQVNNL